MTSEARADWLHRACRRQAPAPRTASARSESAAPSTMCASGGFPETSCRLWRRRMIPFVISSRPGPLPSCCCGWAMRLLVCVSFRIWRRLAHSLVNAPRRQHCPALQSHEQTSAGHPSRPRAPGDAVAGYKEDVVSSGGNNRGQPSPAPELRGQRVLVHDRFLIQSPVSQAIAMATERNSSDAVLVVTRRRTLLGAVGISSASTSAGTV